MMMEFPGVFLHEGRAKSLQRFHPWVFSRAIRNTDGILQDGDTVQVLDHKGRFLGLGHFQKGSIRVRIFSFSKVSIDHSFWVQKIGSALKLREQLGLTDNAGTNCYRLVFAEGDGLPGLVVDYYNGICIMQCHSVGMHRVRHQIAEALKELFGNRLSAIYDRSVENLPVEYASTIENAYLFGDGSSHDHLAVENGLKFWIDWESGQKTGFFLDQRENRKLLMNYSKGRRVLDAFCYSGSFSMYALEAGATEVVSVDVSKRASEVTLRNAGLNSFSGKHTMVVSDVFDFFNTLGKNADDAAFDVIVLDPPAFAKHLDARHKAVMGYKRLNYEALRRIRKGGFLFTFSCSQVIDRNLFESTISAAAILAGRNIRVLHHLSQAPDHTVSIFHPEGEYLKGLVLHVE